MPANDTCRIGVYICHCGLNIASKVDVQALEQYAASLPKVALAKTYKFMCSDPGQQLIKDDLAVAQADAPGRGVVLPADARADVPRRAAGGRA
ncbi:MAG: hypothetical protein MZV70_15810 [Desulfobacterales bacterium]|nr:hypothetical protein [Desulfobacterales bacterium]